MSKFRYILCGIIYVFILSCSMKSNVSQNLSGTGVDCTNGLLIGTRFNSYEELKEVVSIEYKTSWPRHATISYSCNALNITSRLANGVSEKDFERAWNGGISERLKLAIRSPFFVMHRKDLRRVYYLSRRKGEYFGEGDMSFYDIAETMMLHIDTSQMDTIYEDDFGEKGYINTFNHIVAQAFITSLYSEVTADYIADTHERARMPELIDGDFSSEQILDRDNGPLDNYVDIINNEVGQALGQELKDKYLIHRHTMWTPDLLSHYLNDIQDYCRWALTEPFNPFKPDDRLVQNFCRKLNRVRGDISLFGK